ncbi:MAG: MFS transporter [Ilumatobacteraceae bacterium]
MPRARVLTFGLLTAVMASGYGVMFTVLDDFRDEYGITESRLGLIVGIGFISSFLAQVFLAPIADRGHARRLVVIGLGVNVLGLLCLAFGETLSVLMLGRFVSGLGLGMVFPAIRRIVILGDRDRLGQNLGLLLACDVAGFAAGPAVSALLVGPFGLSAPFLLIAAASIGCLPVVLRVRVAETDESPRARMAFDLLANRAYVAALCMGAAVYIMIGAFDALWAVVLDDIEASEWVANLGITLFVLPLIVLGPIGGRLAQRVGPFRVGPVGLVAAAGFMFLYGLMPSGLWMLAIALVHSVTDGLTVSSTSVAVGMVTPDDRHAGAQGLLGGIQTLLAGVVAVLAGVLYEFLGRVVAYGTAAGIMLALVVAAVVLSGDTRRRPIEVASGGGAVPVEAEPV